VYDDDVERRFRNFFEVVSSFSDKSLDILSSSLRISTIMSLYWSISELWKIEPVSFHTFVMCSR